MHTTKSERNSVLNESRIYDLCNTGAVLHSWAIILCILNIWTLTYSPVKLHFVTKQACQWDNIDNYAWTGGEMALGNWTGLFSCYLPTASTYFLFRNKAMPIHMSLVGKWFAVMQCYCIAYKRMAMHRLYYLLFCCHPFNHFSLCIIKCYAWLLRCLTRS